MVDCTLPLRSSNCLLIGVLRTDGAVSGKAEPEAFQSPNAASASLKASASLMRPVITSKARSGRKRWACAAFRPSLVVAAMEACVGCVRA